MIDLIIPYYNNRIGLLNTLKSIDQSIFKITIIDDHSIEPPLFPLNAAQLFRLNINCGPGYARQQGINKTNNEWIMFIDTGDIFVDTISQILVNQAINDYSNSNIISFQYDRKEQLLDINSNRLHGVIFKRAFLNKYNITFSSDGSYLNEDIGFIKACRYCTEAENNPIIYVPTKILKWVEDINSLTQKNNHICLYRDQTRALALNAIHMINICQRNNININDEINQIAGALYYWFIRTIVERPEYAVNAWDGTKIFYDKFANQISEEKLIVGTTYFKKCLQYRNKVNFSINIRKFKNEILTSENIPSYYLTFS